MTILSGLYYFKYLKNKEEIEKKANFCWQGTHDYGQLNINMSDSTWLWHKTCHKVTLPQC